MAKTGRLSVFLAKTGRLWPKQGDRAAKQGVLAPGKHYFETFTWCSCKFYDDVTSVA